MDQSWGLSCPTIAQPTSRQEPVDSLVTSRALRHFLPKEPLLGPSKVPPSYFLPRLLPTEQTKGATWRAGWGIPVTAAVPGNACSRAFPVLTSNHSLASEHYHPECKLPSGSRPKYTFKYELIFFFSPEVRVVSLPVRYCRDFPLDSKL